MGQIAEDMLDGCCCELCGCYFEDPTTGDIYTHGHPAVCWDCWDDLTAAECRDYQRSEVNTF